ncbi:MAG: hypothetical protein OXQ92_03875, partial [Boseongicola sp.]|nr:hypothetical protein [Boseongicola sp.]
EYVMMYLDQRGISFSSKSACLERSDASRSHVVAALGGPAWRATNTLRISFGRDSLAEDITTIAEKIIEAIEKYKTFG